MDVLLVIVMYIAAPPHTQYTHPHFDSRALIRFPRSSESSPGQLLSVEPVGALLRVVLSLGESTWQTFCRKLVTKAAQVLKLTATLVMRK